jgi:hypothetical protein
MSIPTIGSSAYKAWVDAQSASRIVVIEFQPAEALTTWAATGGATPNIYETAFSIFAETDRIPGGIYRRLDSVEENGDPLTVRASLALVNSNAGSWRYENGKIYVRTTGSVNPTTVSSITAVFTIFVGTESFDIVGGELYEGRIAAQLPQIEATVDTLYGAKILASGDVSLPNGDGLFDRLSKKWAWHGRYASIFLGGRELAFGDFEPVARMVVDQVLPNDQECRIVLQDEQDVLESFLPTRTFTREENPNAGDDTIGTYVPLLYGEVLGISPPCIDRTPGATVFLAGDPTVQTLTAVWNVRAIENGLTVGLSLGDDYTVNLSACTVTVTRVDLVDTTLFIDARGPASVATMADLLRELLLVLGTPAADIDTATFTAAGVIYPEPFGLWIQNGQPASDYVTRIEASMIAALVRNREGLWTLLLDDVGASVADLPQFFDEDFKTWAPNNGGEAQVSEVRVRFDYRPAGDTTSEASASDGPTRYTQKAPQSWSLTSVLRHRGDALRLAQQYLVRLKNRPIHIDFSETGLTMMTSTAFTAVRVTRERAPSTTGAYDDRVMFIGRLAKLLSPPQADGTLIDRPDVAEMYGRAKDWASDSIPSWGSSSGAERLQYAYWHNDSDEVTSGVTDQAVWI